jgi:hypothetical protein
VRLTVSVAGGVLNRDRVLSVDDHELRVAEDGEVRAHRRLARADVDHLHDLAARVAGLDLPPSKPGEYAVDGGTTTIEIADDATRDPVHQRIVLSAGDDAPEPVWALLDAVKALSRPDGAQAEGGRAGL